MSSAFSILKIRASKNEQALSRRAENKADRQHQAFVLGGSLVDSEETGQLTPSRQSAARL